MKTVFLTAGHEIVNGVGTGVHIGDLDEAVEARKLVTDVAKHLYANHKIMAITDKDSWNLTQTASEVGGMAETDSLWIDFHFNAATPRATGTEIFIPKEHTEIEFNAAQSLVNTVASTLEVVSRGVKTEDLSQHSRLHILSSSNVKHAANMLLEVIFLTNRKDVRNYREYYSLLTQKLAETIHKITTKSL